MITVTQPARTRGVAPTSLDEIYPPTALAIVSCLCCPFPGMVCACLAFLKSQECAEAIQHSDFVLAKRKREEAMRLIYMSWISGLIATIYVMNANGYIGGAGRGGAGSSGGSAMTVI